MHVNVSLLSHCNCNVSSDNKLGINAKHCTCLSLDWCSGAFLLPPWRRKEVRWQSISTWLSSKLGSQVGLKQLEVCCHFQCIEATTCRILTAALKWLRTHIMPRCPWDWRDSKDQKDYSCLQVQWWHFIPYCICDYSAMFTYKSRALKWATFHCSLCLI